VLIFLLPLLLFSHIPAHTETFTRLDLKNHQQRGPRIQIRIRLRRLTTFQHCRYVVLINNPAAFCRVVYFGKLLAKVLNIPDIGLKPCRQADLNLPAPVLPMFHCTAPWQSDWDFNHVR